MFLVDGLRPTWELDVTLVDILEININSFLQGFRALVSALFTMYCHVGRTSKSVYIHGMGSKQSELRS